MITLAVLALVGCGTAPPAGIPDSPGEMTKDVLPNLLTVASPDLPWLLWTTATGLAEEEYRDCPAIYLRDDGMFADAGAGCTDSFGVYWEGSVAERVDADTGADFFTFTHFRADDGSGGWEAHGSVLVEAYDAETATLTTQATVTALGGGDELLLWLDTETVYAQYDGVTYADRLTGTVGIADWGTAAVSGTLIPVALSRECGYANHFSGRLQFSASDGATLTFRAAVAAAQGDAGGETVYLGDTGGGATDDTGGTVDSASDTADTGPTDTGPTDTGPTDTGDTADTDAGDTDTSETGDTGADGTDDRCGECADATLAGQALDECVTATPTLSSPFPTPF